MEKPSSPDSEDELCVPPDLLPQIKARIAREKEEKMPSLETKYHNWTADKLMSTAPNDRADHQSLDKVTGVSLHNQWTRKKRKRMNSQAATTNECRNKQKRTIQANANLKTRDMFGYTPLHWAAHQGRAEVVKALIQANANLETKDSKYGRTPLSWAAFEGHAEVVKALIQANANLETKDSKYGRTPLSWAAENGHTEVVKALIQANANLETKDERNG